MKELSLNLAGLPLGNVNLLMLALHAENPVAREKMNENFVVKVSNIANLVFKAMRFCPESSKV